MLAIRALDFTFFRMKTWVYGLSIGVEAVIRTNRCQTYACLYITQTLGWWKKADDEGGGTLKVCSLNFLSFLGQRERGGGGGVWFHETQVYHQLFKRNRNGLIQNRRARGFSETWIWWKRSLYARLARRRSPTRIHPLASLLTPSQPTTSYSGVESNE